MHEEIKLIAKPTKPNICLFVCAVLEKDMQLVNQQSYYKIEDALGNRYLVYARDDRDFYRKVIGKFWLKKESFRNPTFL